MPTDHAGEPLRDFGPADTYHGFSGAAPPPPRRRLPRPTARNLAIGTAIALALGIGGGFLLRPNIDNANIGEPPKPMAALPIQVEHPPPETVTSNGKLEVLPPDQAAAARATITTPNVSAEFSLPAAPPPAPEPIAPRVADARPLVAPPAVRSGPPIPAPLPRTGPDCSGARSAAEAMVCNDPDLAAADRELNRAYRRAMQAGAVPPGVLRADQRDWLAIREDAARHSRRALAQVYQQRIDELNDAARSDDEDGPGF
jgi:uncharacterized protein YecT (DUF1311 family)